MKILFSSYAYAPGIGGIETASALLAQEFVANGHEIILITETEGESSFRSESFQVVRNPTPARLWQLLRWCDIVFQNNISLRHLIPALLLSKRILVVQQTWIRDSRGKLDWNSRIKRRLLRRVKNVAVSEAVARDVNFTSVVIGNPYDDRIFRINPNVYRDRKLIFVGRLVSDKGADVLLHAVEILKGRNIHADLTIIGRGAEEETLRAFVRKSGLEQAVTFAGERVGRALAELMNRHQVIIIPSRWPEPFGIVALEGMACGCVPVGSEGGGLPEAIGSCGLTFANGDTEQLAQRLCELLNDSRLREKFRQAAPAHLERFRICAVAQRYLTLLRDLAR